jgi:hypothetical protein
VINWHLRDCLPFPSRNLRLCTVEDLLELTDSVPHAGVQVSLRALDMVVQVVTEQLDVRNRGCRNGRVEEMAREENECDVSDFIGLPEAWDIADFQRRFTIGV